MGFLNGRFDTLTNGVIRMVHIEAQAAELLLHLQNFELWSACRFEFDY